ncbi:hypothetical protein V8F20_002043 [Naviculisporaceae sp. PSN 640]
MPLGHLSTSALAGGGVVHRFKIHVMLCLFCRLYLGYWGLFTLAAFLSAIEEERVVVFGGIVVFFPRAGLAELRKDRTILWFISPVTGGRFHRECRVMRQNPPIGPMAQWLSISMTQPSPCLRQTCPNRHLSPERLRVRFPPSKTQRGFS